MFFLMAVFHLADLANPADYFLKLVAKKNSIKIISPPLKGVTLMEFPVDFRSL